MVTAPGVVGREAVVADGARDARQEPAHLLLVERVEDIDMHGLPAASAATAWTITGSTVSNLPGQLSRLWGQDSQVPAWGDHSAGMR